MSAAASTGRVSLKRFRLALALAAWTALAAPPLAARVIGTNTPAPSLTAERIATLPASEQGAWRAYLERSDALAKADRASLAAERNTDHLWPAPPEHYGAGVKSMPLDRDAAWYASAEAHAIAENVVSFQTPAGGWSKNQNRAAPPRAPGQNYAGLAEQINPDLTNFDAPHDIYWTFVGTLDNGATIGEMRFLARVIAALPPGSADRGRYEASFVRGVRYLLAAQYPNGGWPQVYPLEGGFHDAVTFNDNAIARCITLLEEIASDPQYAFVPADMRDQAKAATARGTALVLKAQWKIGGTPTGWPQQADPLTLAPVSARNYEPPAVASGETTEVLLFLMERGKPTPAIRQAVLDGVHWLETSATYNKTWTSTPEGRKLLDRAYGNPLWARMYDPATGKPIFGDWDKTIHDDVNEISPGRRNGYGWYVTEPEKAIDAFQSWSRVYKVSGAVLPCARAGNPYCTTTPGSPKQ
jgi:PelA/Pel-15E family pectate lyase